MFPFQEVITQTPAEVPLPDGLCERLKASDWSERFEAVSELETFVNTYPTALAPHLRKVNFQSKLMGKNVMLVLSPSM